jgi:hypothetical protein
VAGKAGTAPNGPSWRGTTLDASVLERLKFRPSSAFACRLRAHRTRTSLLRLCRRPTSRYGKVLTRRQGPGCFNLCGSSPLAQEEK